MIAALARKARQVAGDPVLRRWLFGRAVGRHPGLAPFAARRPPYLQGLLPLALERPGPMPGHATGDRGASQGTLHLPLPGRTVAVQPGAPEHLFDQAFDDTETLLAVHRFAWLPLLGDTVAPVWLAALWHAWQERFAEPDDGWAWHPYTAAERAINILDFAARHGLPEPAASTAGLLARHAPAIAERLEYFGEHHTSNHLSNNGRGLYRLGLALGLSAAAEMGKRILLAEAARIFAPSGVLREGSSHYHLLLTRNYADAWLAARRHGRPEAADLQAVVQRALAVLPHLDLPGGLPLVGDISPDAPPAFFSGLLPGRDMTNGWTGLLRAEDQDALRDLRDSARETEGETLRRDGWLRCASGRWSGLWHAAPQGWSFMPGHGHQDAGAFELHYGDTAVFVDAGRGAYGETGEAALYRSARVHNTLSIDSADPYPANRPYYDDSFRGAVGGPPPALTRDGTSVQIDHHGFGRLNGVGAVRRRWQLDGSTITLRDTVEGTGHHRIRRALLTPLDVTVEGNAARLREEGLSIALKACGALRVEPATRWRAYGTGEPASLIVAEATVDLPWSGHISIAVEGA